MALFWLLLCSIHSELEGKNCVASPFGVEIEFHEIDTCFGSIESMLFVSILHGKPRQKKKKVRSPFSKFDLPFTCLSFG